MNERGHEHHEGHEGHDQHAGHSQKAGHDQQKGHDRHDGHGQHGGHDQHGGHSPEMFRDRFGLSLALTIPVSSTVIVALNAQLLRRVEL